jgi:malate dehydrogenase
MVLLFSSPFLTVNAGDAFGNHRTLELRLLDIHHCQKKLEGVKLEIDDSAYPLVDKVMTTMDPAEAFQDTDVAILLGGFPRKPGMQRNDLIAQNASIMKEHVCHSPSPLISSLPGPPSIL